jgi:catechol 2,3-dioxygenase-like lactoylglutathione lyase family enzyme
MLAHAPVGAAVPAQDFERARAFYAETLGLPVAIESEGNVIFECGGATRIVVFASPYAGTNQATAAGWEVDDIQAVMSELRAKGVVFEEYDLPGIKTVDGVASFGPRGENKVAYFKDTEGNILSLAQPAPT